MLKRFIPMTLFAFMLTFYSCTATFKTDSDSHSFDLSGVTQISSDVPALFIIHQGPEQSAFWEGEAGILANLSVRKDGNQLRVRLTRKDLKPTRPIRFELTLAQLRQITLEGSAAAAIEAAEFEDLFIKVSGSSEVSLMEVSLKRLQIESSGKALVTGTGTCKDLLLKSWNEAQQSLQGLKVENAEVELFGKSQSDLNVDFLITGQVKERGRLWNKGAPSNNLRKK